jgi:hypothetical protein
LPISVVRSSVWYRLPWNSDCVPKFPESALARFYCRHPGSRGFSIEFLLVFLKTGML